MARRIERLTPGLPEILTEKAREMGEAIEGRFKSEKERRNKFLNDVRRLLDDPVWRKRICEALELGKEGDHILQLASWASFPAGEVSVGDDVLAIVWDYINEFNSSHLARLALFWNERDRRPLGFSVWDPEEEGFAIHFLVLPVERPPRLDVVDRENEVGEYLRAPRRISIQIEDKSIIFGCQCSRFGEVEYSPVGSYCFGDKEYVVYGSTKASVGEIVEAKRWE